MLHYTVMLSDWFWQAGEIGKQELHEGHQRKCKALQLNMSRPGYQSRLGTNWLGSSFAENVLIVRMHRHPFQPQWFCVSNTCHQWSTIVLTLHTSLCVFVIIFVGVFTVLVLFLTLSFLLHLFYKHRRKTCIIYGDPSKVAYRVLSWLVSLEHLFFLNTTTIQGREKYGTGKRLEIKKKKKKNDNFRAKLLYNTDPRLDSLSFKINTVPQSYLWKLHLGRKCKNSVRKY